MCLEAVSEEELRRVWHKDGYTEGINAGRSEKAIEGAINLLKMDKLSPEEIAQAQGLPLEKVLELQKEIAVHA